MSKMLENLEQECTGAHQQKLDVAADQETWWCSMENLQSDKKQVTVKLLAMERHLSRVAQ
jgi:hypothetical protein